MLLDGKDRWLLWCGDIKTAFLQGTPDPRKLPLFLLPPQDGVTKLAGTFKAPLYKIVGNIYGLASAPRTWSLHVVKTLVQAGFRQHSLDKMLFTLCTKLPGDDHTSLVAIVVAYVDDFLLTHNERWDRRALLDLFKSGACRPTLAAEASACDTGIDRASFMAHLISEILQDKASFLLTRTLRLIGVTDCRSLYDVLVSENPRTEDKWSSVRYSNT